jgi:hypothetical protein
MWIAPSGQDMVASGVVDGAICTSCLTAMLESGEEKGPMTPMTLAQAKELLDWVRRNR